MISCISVSDSIENQSGDCNIRLVARMTVVVIYTVVDYKIMNRYNLKPFQLTSICHVHIIIYLEKSRVTSVMTVHDPLKVCLVWNVSICIGSKPHTRNYFSLWKL